MLLAPKLGLLRTSFLFGILNASVALWTTWLFRAEVTRPGEKAVRAGVVLGILGLGFVYSGSMTAWAEKACTATT
ncbi:spermidine synthase [compost metagenome]